VQNCEIRDSILSEGCIINDSRIIRSVIGLRSRIGRGAQVEASIIMGADYYQSIEDMREDVEAGAPRMGIGENSVVRRAIIDKNARIGAGVKLLNDAGIEEADAPDGSYYIRDRIIIVPKNAIVKDGTVV